MEIVAAADSDERGLSLLRVVNILQRVVVYLHSFKVNKTRGQLPTSPSNSEAQQMPGMSDEELAKKVRVSPSVAVEHPVAPKCQHLFAGVCRSFKDYIYLFLFFALIVLFAERRLPNWVVMENACHVSVV